KLVLLYGGQSGEHEISLQSAASVLAHLDENQYDVMPIGMDKKGCLYLNNAADLIKNHPNSLPVKLAHSEKLPSLINHGQFIVPADVVFPVMHGPLCEDGALQGVLDLAGIAYVGCNVLASAMCMDKDIARQLAVIEGVEPIRYHRLPHTSVESHDKTWCEEAAKALGFPLFVKPCSLGSSVGIHRVENLEDLLKAVKDARQYDRTVLVEEYIEGREIELAVLEHDGAEGLPDVSVPGEIKTDHSDGFYSYAAKYTECEALELCIPADLDADLTRRLQVAAVEIFIRLRAAGLARVDFFVQDDKNKIYFNEINTLPGFTTVSMFPKLWEASGLNYSVLLDRLIRAALERQLKREALVTDYASVSPHVSD
ncbi:MAG: D-alanine--D-alanine ligase family protein, partial [Legionella sp.]|nr:D-alanine--D-alanine ligase family protein [Legionella sp.]